MYPSLLHVFVAFNSICFVFCPSLKGNTLISTLLPFIGLRVTVPDQKLLFRSDSRRFVSEWRSIGFKRWCVQILAVLGRRDRKGGGGCSRIGSSVAVVTERSLHFSGFTLLLFLCFFVSHSTGARTFINRLTEYRVMSVDALQCGPLASVTRILDAIFLGFLFLALVALGMGFFLGFLPPLFTYCFPCLAVSCFLF